ncbi:MAG: hypothetical protein D8M59_05790 [Planctomycetes bacterium]|nr:hypothetical protein [Planctomycetota bacterium]
MRPWFLAEIVQCKARVDASRFADEYQRAKKRLTDYRYRAIRQAGRRARQRRTATLHWRYLVSPLILIYFVLACWDNFFNDGRWYLGTSVLVLGAPYMAYEWQRGRNEYGRALLLAWRRCRHRLNVESSGPDRGKRLCPAIPGDYRRMAALHFCSIATTLFIATFPAAIFASEFLGEDSVGWVLSIGIVCFLIALSVELGMLQFRCSVIRRRRRRHCCTICGAQLVENQHRCFECRTCTC